MNNIKNRVFLGGTCNNSKWRESIIALLDIDYFNPVVKDWTPECQVEEMIQREECDFCLYVITPKMTGVYSVAEVVDDSNKRQTKTIFVPLFNDEDSSFTEFQWRSLEATAKMVEANGAKVFYSLSEAAKYMNRFLYQQCTLIR